MHTHTPICTHTRARAHINLPDSTKSASSTTVATTTTVVALEAAAAWDAFEPDERDTKFMSQGALGWGGTVGIPGSSGGVCRNGDAGSGGNNSGKGMRRYGAEKVKREQQTWTPANIQVSCCDVSYDTMIQQNKRVCMHWSSMFGCVCLVMLVGGCMCIFAFVQCFLSVSLSVVVSVVVSFCFHVRLFVVCASPFLSVPFPLCFLFPRVRPSRGSNERRRPRLQQGNKQKRWLMLGGIRMSKSSWSRRWQTSTFCRLCKQRRRP